MILRKSLDALSYDLARSTGIKLQFSQYPYDKLYDKIKEDSQKSKSDIFLLDMPWFPEFASNGMLTDLTNYVNDSDMDTNELFPETIKQYLNINNSIYALPHRFTQQLIFYRKDLFEDFND